MMRRNRHFLLHPALPRLGCRYFTLALCAFLVLALSLAQPSHAQQFLRGGDISELPRLEQSGQIYYDDGVPMDCVKLVAKHGWNVVRIRLWVNPSVKDSFPCNLPYDLALAKRVKAAGMKIWLDFHYSDSWADPGKQPTPAAWAGMTQGQLRAQVQAYTTQVIAAFRNSGVLPDYVQVGNEVTNGMLWPNGQISSSGWSNFAGLLKAGVKGVKAGASPSPMPKIVIHIDNGWDWNQLQWFFDNLNAQGVPYDIIGLSYYPDYTTTLSDIQSSLQKAAARYGKPLVLAETGYPHTGQTSGTPKYPYTPLGQSSYLSDLVSVVKATPNGLGRGVIYWEPESIQNSVNAWYSFYNDRALFDQQTGNALPGVSALGGI